MVPVLFRVGGLEVGTHETFVVIGAVVAVTVFWWEARRRRLRDPRLWTIAAGSLLAGAVFAKLGTGWQYLADDTDPSLVGLWLHGGKSVLGGLAGAYFGVLVTKRLVGYTHKTGDLFAPAAAVGIAVGRIGCFLTEPVGTPTSLPWGIAVSPEAAERMPTCTYCTAGVPMHPSLLYEIAALLVIIGLLHWLRPRLTVPGELFKVFLVTYGTFRFFVEFVRDHETFVLGLTGSQIFLQVTLPLLYAYFGRQLIRHAYRPSDPGPVVVGTTS
jgi:prolipoprotein diacylglyceryltransferase